MLSLFSSFDYCWNFFPTLSELFFLFLLFTSSYVASSKLFFKKILTSFLFSFLESLCPKGFSKFSTSLFLFVMVFIFFMNFYSVLPFSIPHSSQVSLILLFGGSFWVSFFIFFNFFNPKGFLSHCIPEGSPMPLVPVLLGIELISNIIRPVTLTVRLVANILAGHLLLLLLSKVVYSASSAMPAYLLLNLVEFFVAAVQSYIFLTMITLYYCDVA